MFENRLERGDDIEDATNLLNLAGCESALTKMRIEIEDPTRAQLLGCLAIVLSCPFGFLVMIFLGDRDDTRSVTIDNRTREPLFIADATKGFQNGPRFVLPERKTTRVQPFDGFASSRGENRDLAFFEGETNLTPVLTLTVDDRTLQALNVDKAWILVEAGPKSRRARIVDRT